MRSPTIYTAKDTTVNKQYSLFANKARSTWFIRKKIIQNTGNEMTLDGRSIMISDVNFYGISDSLGYRTTEELTFLSRLSYNSHDQVAQLTYNS